ncbi:MAG: hypothetical protein ACI8WB_001136 [Phenylobacterium sp.]|jgi:hypothetical protein
MKSPSDQNNSIEQQVNAALDQSVNGLSVKTQMDIARVRNQALALAANPVKAPSMFKLLATGIGQIADKAFPKVAIPMAAAVLIGVAVNYNSVEQVPELPLAMLTSEIPAEALTLLEDLEFVTWLAENEQEVLL